MIFQHLVKNGQLKSLASMMRYPELYNRAAKWLYQRITLTRNNAAGLFYGLPNITAANRLHTIAQLRKSSYLHPPATPPDNLEGLAWPIISRPTADESFTGDATYTPPTTRSERKVVLLSLIQYLEIENLPREYDLAGFLANQLMSSRLLLFPKSYTSYSCLASWNFCWIRKIGDAECDIFSPSSYRSVLNPGIYVSTPVVF